MRIQFLSAAVVLCSAIVSASSAEVSVTECLRDTIEIDQVRRDAANGVTADYALSVTNHLDVAIAALEGEVAYRTEGRSVPWKTERRVRVPIPGGIEPGETRDIHFGTKRGQDWVEPLVADVVIHDAIGPDGASLALSAGACSAPAMNPEAQALLEAASKCWVVDVGGAAANVSITVGVTVAQGRVGRELLLVSAGGGDELAAETAFQNVRRALLRCQGDGYLVDDGLYEITFSPRSTLGAGPRLN
ncbi:hypothetical protein [Salipiger sp. PrR003]|uniref:hypothetical protein n=1 Tax=Salipiger sp. PrR003 TaxID=2706776 RepID=UPI0013DA69E9|nr:hypothetical protein [Salipiger sp. PrR003]NDV52944.1 hypothetical protein [Salipiger sp. PrR003]